MKVFALLALVAATELQVTPVQKVIQLLQGMAEKGKKEKHEEQVQFAAYKQFCDDTTVEKQRAIKEANAKMEQLSAAIQKAEADAATLSKEIAGLDEDISVWEGDKKASTEVPMPPTFTKIPATDQSNNVRTFIFILYIITQ